MNFYSRQAVRLVSCPTLVLLTLTILSVLTANSQEKRVSGPTLLTYHDLVTLYENEEPSDDLQKKLTELLTTPFVNNSINSSSYRFATKLSDNSLRVANWNIARGLETISR